MTTSTAINNCIFYRVSLNNNGEPIVGTMQAYSNNQIQDPCVTAWLPPYQMEIPAGKGRCFPRNHQRFFYKVNKITGKVVPNSLFTHIGQVPRCDGQNDVLEYIIHN